MPCCTKSSPAHTTDPMIAPDRLGGCDYGLSSVSASRQGAYHWQHTQTGLSVRPQDVPACSNDDYLVLAVAFGSPADLAQCKCQVRSVRWCSDVCQRRLLPLRPASVLRSHGWFEVYVAQAQHVVNRNANEA